MRAKSKRQKNSMVVVVVVEVEVVEVVVVVVERATRFREWRGFVFNEIPLGPEENVLGFWQSQLGRFSLRASVLVELLSQLMIVWCVPGVE